MSDKQLFPSVKGAAIIAGLHLPPSPASNQTTSVPMDSIIDFALKNTEKAVRAGVPALYIQDLADLPVAPTVQAHTVAFLSVVGAAIRKEFPQLVLGVCMMAHGAREPLAVAQAIGAQFVRIKVYSGAMVKAEGLLQGCAYDAITYRKMVGAENIAILADVYDRTGTPLGELPIAEAARFAGVNCKADGLVLTGLSFTESLSMLQEVQKAKLGIPLFLGGGARAENVKEALKFCDGVIVSSSFKPVGGWTEEAILAEWDYERIARFMQAVNA
ncbi:MAG TPA: BtpA/SgcQ family protein [Anaerolineaceae bacterium]|nr:BtpA/SgcQ family protein [Anaerolineaceae bacterium]